MAYNAGEYRVLGALKRGGQVARNATPETLPGLSPITQAYVRKLHALSCLLEQADDREEWLQALDRPVPRLQAVTVPDRVTDIASWARRNGQDAAQLQRLNPAFLGGRLTHADGKSARLLAVAADVAPESSASGALDSTTASTGTAAAMTGSDAIPTPAITAAAPVTTVDSGTTSSVSPGGMQAATSASVDPPVASTGRRHTVVRGDSAWKISDRYGIRVPDLLQRNGLDSGSVLRPGKVLVIDAEVAAGDPPKTAAGTP
jgi:membrane-bound lytic murein transglycosylase D